MQSVTKFSGMPVRFVYSTIRALFVFVDCTRVKSAVEQLVKIRSRDILLDVGVTVNECGWLKAIFHRSTAERDFVDRS
jgi:hypothetical protein